MNVITRGMRNAFRNTIRTFSIVVILGLSIGLALTMLIARQAVAAKIDSVKSSIGNSITVSPAGARGFEGGGEPLTLTQVGKIKLIPHVTSVSSTLQDRLQSTDTSLVSAIEAGTLGRRFSAANGLGAAGNGRGGGRNFTPPVGVVGAVVVDSTALNGGGTFTISDGKPFDGSKDANVAVIGKTLAAKNNLTVGSTFTAYATTFTITGIYDAGNTFSDNSVIMPLVTVQRLSAQPDQISSATVQVDAIQNTDATVTAIQNTLGTTVADVTSQQSRAANALTPLQNILSISLYSLIGAIGAGAAIILLTMMMIVRERRREIGVLKAIGSSNVKVVAQFMTEAVTFTLLAAVVGLGIGVAAAGTVTKVLVSTSTGSAATGAVRGIGGPSGGFGRGLGRGISQGVQNIQTTVGWDILLYGLGAALLIAIVGSAIPSLIIAKVRPAEVMRAE